MDPYLNNINLLNLGSSCCPDIFRESLVLEKPNLPNKGNYSAVLVLN